MKTFVFIYFALTILILSSCQKSGEATVAGVNGQCITNAASCNTSAYAQARGYGYYPYGSGSGGYATNYGYGSNYGNGSNYYGYGYNYSAPFTYYNNNAYLCNCPAGTIPTYNGYAGLGCVSTSNLNYGWGSYFYMGWGSSNWYTMPNLNSYSGCYSGAVQSCAINVPNSCPTGSYCLSNFTGSTLGLCTAGNHR